MRKLTLSILSACAVMTAAAQYSPNGVNPLKPYPAKDWQVGFSPGAMTVNILKFEARRHLEDRHFLGLAGGPMIGQYNAGQLFQTQNWKNIRGGFVMLTHKFYLNQKRPGRFAYIDHGPFFQNANVDYDGVTFEPFEEDGTTFYRPKNTELQYNSQRVGYDISFGLEYLMDNFYVDLSLGMGYVFQVKDDGEPPSGYNLTRFSTGPNYQGIRLLPALKIGFML